VNKTEENIADSTSVQARSTAARQRRKMKIAFVVHDYHRGGGHSRYVAELATRFCKQHEVHVFANRIVDDGTPGIHFHKVPAWRANAFTTVLSFALPVTVQVGGGFDIVHSQGFCGLLGNVFTGHMCNKAWDVALRKFAGGASTREAIFNKVTGAIEHAMYRFARNSRMIAVSERVQQDLVQYYQCPSPIHVIYHGVDLEVFSPAGTERLRREARRSFGVPEDETVFLYVGNLRKGAKLSMQALAHLERGVLLCVAATERGPYQEFAAQCGVADRVYFAGHTNQVERAYAAGDALLLPTPYDPFAMVVSEAMACGVPVVVSREAGVAELIRSGTNGLLLEDVTSHEELARHMRALAADSRWAAALGSAGRKTVENLTWDSVADQTLEVYYQLLEDRQ